MALLRRLHERRGRAELDVRAGLDEKVGHLREAAAAGERERRLLRLLRLCVDVGALAQQEGHHLLVALARGLHQRGVALVVDLSAICCT